MSEYHLSNPLNPFHNTLLSQLYKVKITQVEMIRDRGYDISNDNILLRFRDKINMDDESMEYKIPNENISKKQKIEIEEFNDFANQFSEYESPSFLSQIYKNKKNESLKVYYVEISNATKKLGNVHMQEILKNITS